MTLYPAKCKSATYIWETAVFDDETTFSVDIHLLHLYIKITYSKIQKKMM